MAERGEIRNKRFATEIFTFKKLRWNNITPSNIDFAVEFSNKLFVFGEGKYKDSDLPRGQAICLERICDAINDGGNKSLFIHYTHDGSEDGNEIDTANCKVVMYRFNKVNRDVVGEITVKELIDSCLKKLGISFDKKQSIDDFFL